MQIFFANAFDHVARSYFNENIDQLAVSYTGAKLRVIAAALESNNFFFRIDCPDDEHWNDKDWDDLLDGETKIWYSTWIRRRANAAKERVDRRDAEILALHVTLFLFQETSTASDYSRRREGFEDRQDPYQEMHTRSKIETNFYL